MKNLLIIASTFFLFFGFAQSSHAKTLHPTKKDHQTYMAAWKKGRSIASEEEVRPVSRKELLGKTYVSEDGKAKLVINKNGSWQIDAKELQHHFGGTSFSGNNIKVVYQDGYNVLTFSPEINDRELQAFVGIFTDQQIQEQRQRNPNIKIPRVFVGVLYGSIADGEYINLGYYEK